MLRRSATSATRSGGTQQSRMSSHWLSSVERTAGRYEEAVAHGQQAFRLDPRSVLAAVRLQDIYLWLRRYPEALDMSEAALALAPGDLSASENKAMVYAGQGDLAGATASDPSDLTRPLLARKWPPTSGSYWDLYWLLDEPQQELLLRLTPAAFDNDRGAWATVLMQLSWLRGDRAHARALADTAWQETRIQLRAAPGGCTAARPRRADAGLPGPEERSDRAGTQRPWHISARSAGTR